MATEVEQHVIHEEQSFLRRYVFSLDHKIIGIQYFLTAIVMALVGGFLAMLIRLNLAWPGEKWAILGALFPSGAEDGILKPEFYIALVTMHGTIMVFFVISFALVSGFGNYLIPLQIGARDMAFPFLNMLSYWIAVPASIIMLASFLVEGGAAASGWTAYPPLSAVREPIVAGSMWGQTLWLLAMALFIVSFTMGDHFLRAGLDLRRVREDSDFAQAATGRCRLSKARRRPFPTIGRTGINTAFVLTAASRRVPSNSSVATPSMTL